MLSLHYKIYGEGQPIIIAHGLFGMLDNWQGFAKQLSKSYQVITVDLRDHGKSPHSEEFRFDLAASDIRQLMSELGLSSAHLIGHSLGGKVMMRFAQLYPDLADKLIVVDMATKAYAGGHEYIFDALLSVPINTVSSRSEVDALLNTAGIKHPTVRLFLMKNLKRTDDGYAWKANIQQLHKDYGYITSAIPNEVSHGDALFIRGEKSDYILDSDISAVNAIFPKAKISTIDNAGHWVHAEQPKALLELMQKFLKAS